MRRRGPFRRRNLNECETRWLRPNGLRPLAGPTSVPSQDRFVLIGSCGHRFSLQHRIRSRRENACRGFECGNRGPIGWSFGVSPHPAPMRAAAKPERLRAIGSRFHPTMKKSAASPFRLAADRSLASKASSPSAPEVDSPTGIHPMALSSRSASVHANRRSASAENRIRFSARCVNARGRRGRPAPRAA
jgi:hypothetical protein